MKILYSLFGLFMITVSATGAKELSAGFTSLPIAVQFISETLDADDAAGLSNACMEQRPGFKNAFERLKYVHKQKPLTNLYAGREFPKSGTTFKLGGHDSELGHVHLDFEKKNDLWYIRSIWLCR